MLKRLASLFIILVLAGCGGDKDNGAVVPPPTPGGGSTQTNPGTDPGTDPGTEPGTNPGTNPGTDADAQRLARIGQTPIAAIYFTHYTSASEFPTLEDVKCFTHINIGHTFFKNPKTGDGGLVLKDPAPDYIRRMVAYKKDYPELKVLLFVGGWGRDFDGFSEMARSAEKRQLFCSECVRLCNEYGLDGVDIDWEYPTYGAKEGSYVNGADPSDKANYSTMMKELREALGTDKIISYAAASDDASSSDPGSDYIDNKGVLEWVDYINLMTYSMGNPYPQDPAYQRHNSPLYISSKFWNNRGGADVVENFHNKRGVPYDRMVFGIGFYGHGDGNVYPSSVSYTMAREALEKGTVNGKSVAGYNTRWWDDESKSCYLGDATGVMYASYEDAESISYRTAFALSKGMLGAFVWEYREDDSAGTLRKAFKEQMSSRP